MRRFYGIGIGPGDSELITLRGLNSIKKSKYIFMPKSKGKSTAEEICRDYIKDKNIIMLEFPMGEDNSERYKVAAKEIDKTIGDGETGSFLTLGDPMTYSTYAYLMNELRNYEIEIETVPGITSFAAATSRHSIPLTLKGEDFYMCDSIPDSEILRRVNTICILKVRKIKKEILDLLEANGFDYTYMKRITRTDEETIKDRDEILRDDDYMSLIIGRKI